MGVKTWRRIAALAVGMLFAAVFFLDDPAIRRSVLSRQITPALLTFAGSAVFVFLILLVSALWGRAYCSVLCPAGLLQEAAFLAGRKLRLAKTGFVGAGKPRLLLLVSAVLLAVGLATAASLLDPLGWFGRLAAPLAELVASRRDGAEYHAAYFGLAGLGFLVAALLLAAVSLFKGRWFCDRLCPAGAALGALSDLSIRRIRLDAERCVSCGKCAGICPSRCIDPAGKRVDAARCVLCFSCLDMCPKNAIRYGAVQSGDRRRAIASGISLMCAAAYFAARGWRGAAFAGRAVLPPGAASAAGFHRACVGCQSCVAACPAGIIKPRFPGLQPELRFDLGYCQYNCTRCTHSCPSQALAPLTEDEKRVTRIATTRFTLDRCVVMTEGTACGACAEVCPTRALSMETWEEGKPTRPAFYPGHCIGCGACAHVCPAAPPAFSIEGLARHETALPMREAPAEEGIILPESADGLGDFPF